MSSRHWAPLPPPTLRRRDWYLAGHGVKPRAPADPADVGRHRPQNHIGYPAYAPGAASSTRHFANRYAAFRRDMVYGASPEFETALATITALAGRLE